MMAAAHAVHTHAHTLADTDLFDGTTAAPVRQDSQAANEGPMLEFDGVLVHDAEVRSLPVGDGAHVRPVLCLDLAPLSGLHHSIHAQQIYTEATRASAVALAATLRKGMRVTLTTPLQGMRIQLPHIAGVATTQEPR